MVSNGGLQRCSDCQRQQETPGTSHRPSRPPPPTPPAPLPQKLKTNEIRNGRLAMIACLGMAAQGVMTGKGPFENLLTHLVSNWQRARRCRVPPLAEGGQQPLDASLLPAAPRSPCLPPPLPPPPSASQSDPVSDNLLTNLASILK